jgi:hypothetical protein
VSIHRLLRHASWQRCHLVREQGLGASPHGRALAAPIVQLQQIWQKVVAKRLGALTRQQGGEMVDGDDGEGGPFDSGSSTGTVGAVKTVLML